MLNYIEIINSARLIEPTLSAEGLYSQSSYENDVIKEYEIDFCYEWFKKQDLIKKADDKVTSYTVKHEVEEWIRSKHSDNPYKYISSGAVITIAIYLGIPYKKYIGEHEIDLAIKL